jgi:hypothetical protein
LGEAEDSKSMEKAADKAAAEKAKEADGKDTQGQLPDIATADSEGVGGLLALRGSPQRMAEGQLSVGALKQRLAELGVAGAKVAACKEMSYSELEALLRDALLRQSGGRGRRTAALDRVGKEEPVKRVPPDSAARGLLVIAEAQTTQPTTSVPRKAKEEADDNAARKAADMAAQKAKEAEDNVTAMRKAMEAADLDAFEKAVLDEARATPYLLGQRRV